jgi:hypothetical protein
MPETFQLPSDEFMVLLTDALRTGPGSPEWSQAVKVLRADNQDADEYTLLYRARERLEEGKEYRSVRAGPNFTHKVLEGIDKQGGSSPASTATIIALIAGGVILSVVIIVAVILLRSPADPQQHAIEDLQNTIFGSRITAANFSDGLGSGWRTFGELPVLTTGNELHPAALPTTGPTDTYQAGGWITSDPIPADQLMEVDAVCNPGKSTGDGFVQVFVSDEPITDANTAGGHALVYQLRSGESRAFLPDGKQAPQSEKVGAAGEVHVRIVLSKDLTIIESAGKRLYAGPNLLSSTQPRFVGVRFLGRVGEKWDHLAVASLMVQKP